MNSNITKTFGTYAYIWTEEGNEICVAPSVPDYVREHSYEVFERGVCKSRTYHGGSAVRIASVLRWLLPNVVKEKKKLVSLEEKENVYRLKF